MRRFLPLVLVAVVLGACSALLYPAYASVEWDREARDAWFLLPLLGLVAGGYAWGRWKALVFVGAIPWLALALLLDAAWLTGVWDRSDEYHPLPSTPFVLVFGVPLFAGLVALGVAIRKAVQPPRRPSAGTAARGLAQR
jgi:hypothetical protein